MRSASLEEAVEAILEATIALAGADSGGVYLAGPGSGELSLAAHRNLTPGFIAVVSHFAPDSTQAQTVFRGRSVFHDAQYWRNTSLGELMNQEGLRTLAVIPIPSQDEILGCLNIASHTLWKFPLRSKKALETIARQAGLVIRRFQAEKALQESERRLRIIANTVVDIIWACDLQMRFTYFSPSVERLMGYTPEEMLLAAPMKTLPPHSLQKVSEIMQEEFFKEAQSPGAAGQRYFELEQIRKDGSTFWTEVFATFIRDENQVLTGLVGVTRDITERRQAAAERERQHTVLSAILGSTDDGITYHDAEGRMIFFNTPVAAFFQETLGMVPRSGDNIEDIPFSPRVRPLVLEARRRAMSGESFVYELPVQLPDRPYRVFEIAVNPCLVDGRVTGFSQFLRDVTRKREAEGRLRSSLADKEVLLRELHHRVKNNFTTLISLLGIQMEHISQPETQHILEDLQARVMSMSLVHEHLYRSDDLARIQVQPYFDTLTRNLFESFRATRTVQRHLDCPDLAFDLDTAIPCGLLVNELVTNALKHAFPVGFRSDLPPAIRIGLVRRPADVVIEVRDNGCGLEYSRQRGSQPALGFRLLSILCRQLKGRSECLEEGGTVFRVTFPCPGTRPGVTP